MTEASYFLFRGRTVL